MELNEFNQIGTALFGGDRWGSKLAEAVGVTPGLISQIRTGRATISDNVETKIRQLAANRGTLMAPTNVLAETVTETVMEQVQTREAGFKLRLVATDLLSNKFVKVSDVDPALFFPQFAPQPVTRVVERVVNVAAPISAEDEALETAAILERIKTRFAVMCDIANSVIYKGFPSLIVYGPAGLGKSHKIMAALKAAKEQDADFYYDVIKGSVRAPGLFKALYNAKDGGVVVLDDSDSIFGEEDALNLLKAALDSSETRRISWRKESAWLKDFTDDDGEPVRDFDFNGGVIFITNKNLRKMGDGGKADAEHYKALISRSFYVDLTMDSNTARMLWVKENMIHENMGVAIGLTVEQANEIVDFMEEVKDSLLEISLRMASMIAMVYKDNPETWKAIVKVTKTRQ